MFYGLYFFFLTSLLFYVWMCLSHVQVLANMNTAYKQEKKKNAKRRTYNMHSMTVKIAEPLFSAGDSPSPKKLKESLYLSFPVETVLATEQSGSEDIKTELAYHLAESDVHWGGRCEETAERTRQWSRHELPEVLDRKDGNPDFGELSVKASATNTS